DSPATAGYLNKWRALQPDRTLAEFLALDRWRRRPAGRSPTCDPDFERLPFTRMLPQRSQPDSPLPTGRPTEAVSASEATAVPAPTVIAAANSAAGLVGQPSAGPTNRLG